MIHPNRTEADRYMEVNMMTSPAAWPLWPTLPLKRDISETPNLGWLFADDCDGPFIIRPYKEQTKQEPITYKDANEAFDNGWVVD